MNMQRCPIGNSFERLAINLSELIHDLDGEEEEQLRELLIKAYQMAYRKAALERAEEPLVLAG